MRLVVQKQPCKHTHSAGAPAGNKNVLTTGRDNTLRLYDQSMSQQCSVPHNNNTGRWVMPLRATLGPSDTIICGSMKRAVRLCQHILFVRGRKE